MVSLKHLDLESCVNLTHMPHGLGQLTSLQTLNLFVLSEGPVGSSRHIFQNIYLVEYDIIYHMISITIQQTKWILNGL